MKFSVVTPLWQDRPASENLEIARLADELGFEELWIGEMATYDAFSLATAIGLSTRQIVLTIGPLAVPVRTPMTMAKGIASVVDLTGRSTRLALGASSDVVVREWHGRKRVRTAQHLEETALIVRGLLDGDKVDFSGDLASCRGYRLRLDAPGAHITIAAFGPIAIGVAATQAERMLLNMVTPESLADLSGQMVASAEKARTPAPSLAVWLPTAVNPGRNSIDQMKHAIVGYLAAPGYGEMMAEAGFGKLVKFARTRPHPKELLEAMPDELIHTVGLVGDEAQVESRIEAYRAAGADELCLVPATAGDPAGRETLEYMARHIAS